MTLVSLGFDSGSNVNMWQCDVCGELYGKIPGSKPITDCMKCQDREKAMRFKERVHKAQHAAITLQRAIVKHRQSVEDGYEPTEADLELWKTLDETDVPNDSPTGIVGTITRKKRGS